MEQLRRVTTPIQIRLANLLTRATAVSIKSTTAIYTILAKVKGKPNPENIPMMQHFGFASIPPKDSDLLRVHISSDPDNPLIISSMYQPSQPTDLVEGDSALFDNHSQYIKLKANGINMKSNLINLGVGGNRIARLGDEVTVTIIGGSSSGQHKGTITKAGLNTSL